MMQIKRTYGPFHVMYFKRIDGGWGILKKCVPLSESLVLIGETS